ncbi:MAG: hypothetical protein IJF00_07435 [Bacteroidaceae bacterium]|nr:hypothetical protein [Bacteroidaceae bacterium]
MIRKTLYTILLLMMCSIASAQSYSVIVTNPQLSAMFHIINDLDYEHFLTDGCKDFKTIMIVPTNEGIAEYIDPLSYGNEKLNMWSITYGDVGNTKGFFYGIYDCEFNESTHSWEKGDSLTMIKGTTVLSQSSPLGNRLKDLLENSIIMGEYKEGKLYYKTIGNMIVRIDGIEKGSTIYGPLQMEYNTPLTVVESIVEDGRLVLVVDGPIMGSRKSVYKLLSEKPEFSKFCDIIAECLLYNTGRNRDDYAVGGANLFYRLYLLREPYGQPEFEKCRYLLNDFHYTIYAPTNAAMDEAFAKGLPTLDDLAAAYEVHGPDSAAKIIEIMRNFVVYHIQDHSIFIDKGAKGGKYATAKNVFKLNSYTDSDGNVSTEYKAIMPYKVNVDVTESSLKVTDALGNTHNVLTNSGLYNMVANEYWADGSPSHPSRLVNSSTVVIHAIDGPLMYSNKQFVNEYWDNNYFYYK